MVNEALEKTALSQSKELEYLHWARGGPRKNKCHFGNRFSKKVFGNTFSAQLVFGKREFGL